MASDKLLEEVQSGLNYFQPLKDLDADALVELVVEVVEESVGNMEVYQHDIVDVDVVDMADTIVEGIVDIEASLAPWAAHSNVGILGVASSVEVAARMVHHAASDEEVWAFVAHRAYLDSLWFFTSWQITAYGELADIGFRIVLR